MILAHQPVLSQREHSGPSRGVSGLSLLDSFLFKVPRRDSEPTKSRWMSHLYGDLAVSWAVAQSLEFAPPRQSSLASYAGPPMNFPLVC